MIPPQSPGDLRSCSVSPTAPGWPAHTPEPHPRAPHVLTVTPPPLLPMSDLLALPVDQVVRVWPRGPLLAMDKAWASG